MASPFLFRFLQEDHDHEQHDDEGHEETTTPWGSIVGAALLVQCATFSGLLFVALATLYRRNTSPLLWRQRHRSMLTFISSFSAGALIATVVFLVVPESLKLLLASSSSAHSSETQQHAEEEDHADHQRWLRAPFRLLNETETTGTAVTDEAEHDEHENTWKFGFFFLVGLMIPLIIGAFFPTADEALEELEEQAPPTTTKQQKAPATDEIFTDETNGTTDPDNLAVVPKAEPQTAMVSNVQNASKWSLSVVNPQLASSILIGDFLHNFADGIFLGTAFLLCDSSLAWTLAATTIYHELAQEISDFMLLTEFCHFSILGALLCNFLSGISVVLGAVIVAEFDFQDGAVGCILAVSAGVYTYIAVAECIPKMGKNNRFWCLLCFIFGATPIGLVVLNHKHCEAGHGH